MQKGHDEFNLVNVTCRIVLIIVVLLLQHGLARSVKRKRLSKREIGRVDGWGRDESEDEDIDDHLDIGHVGVELVELEDGQVGETVVLTILDLHIKVLL